jgi:hypothetical protein
MFTTPTLAEQQAQRAAEQKELVEIAARCFAAAVGGIAVTAGPKFDQFVNAEELAGTCVGYAKAIITAVQPKDEL